MTQFWTPTRELTPALRPGLWLMADKGRRIGYIRQEGRSRFICTTPENDPERRVMLGSAPTLHQAAKRLWEWGRSASIAGWRPAHTLVELEPGIWAMPPRPGHVYAQGFIEHEARGAEERFIAQTWATPERRSERIGTYDSLDAAAVAVWECPIKT
ncbi:hypothetical protein RS84_00017 [Microbacterium hydrocarbonoxydans]|uniref:Uncharacterized protein n=1 Tax=Microbacterium hydrocarbonoxydans TaxID=273678 RepID=A0A0M2HYM1_9MICO|nr:hypothetical protein [Microbacterium hydrocarbonoxydans]KJL49543.1 hypothetical protein RS84_00017 [Microbacterium hydrocarbonoxydans]